MFFIFRSDKYEFDSISSLISDFYSFIGTTSKYFSFLFYLILILNNNSLVSIYCNCFHHKIKNLFQPDFKILSGIASSHIYSSSAPLNFVYPLKALLPWRLIWSRIISMTIKVPVRPMPALQCTSTGPAPGTLSWRALTSCRKLSTQPGSAGTPWSGQA